MKTLTISTDASLAKPWLRENGVILTLLAVFTMAKIPSLATPFWWDEAGAYIPPSLEVAERGLWVALPGAHPLGLLYGHPPVLYLLHGGLYRLLGISIVPHRIAMLAFALIGLWFTYKLGSLLCGRSTGLCAAVLLACSPMFFAQSTMVLGDMPIASLGAMSAYYLFAGRPLAYAVAATILLQTKETALATAVAAAVYEVLFVRREIGRWPRFLMHAIPIGSLAAFFAIEYISTGVFVQAPYFAHAPFLIFDLRDPGRAVLVVIEQARWVARVLFWGEGRFILAAMLLGGMAHWRRFWKPEFSLFAFAIAFYWAAFSLIGFLPRYVMPALPFLCIAAAWSVYVGYERRNVAEYVVAGVASLAFLPFFYDNTESGNFETNMEYKKAVAVCKSFSEYLEANANDTRIIRADWPVSSYLRIPALGYVSKGRHVGRVTDVKPDEPLPNDLLVYFSMSSSVESAALVQRSGKTPLRRFEDGGVFAEVYELGSPPER